MMLSALTALLILAASGNAVTRAQPHPDKSRQTRVDPAEYLACGVTCLFTLCKLQRVDVSFDQVRSLLAPGKEGQNSFFDIEVGARKLGLFPVAAKIGSDELACVPVPAILHLQQLEGARDSGHFILLLGLTKTGQPVILDPPLLPFSIDVERLNRQWTGNVLCVAKSKERADSMCRTLGHRRNVYWNEPLMWMPFA